MGSPSKRMKMSVHENIESLPNCLLEEILVLVASHSSTDLFNARLTCKDFSEAANGDYTFEHISMAKFKFIPWRQEEVSFLRRCKESGNPEALFRKGIVEYFSSGELKSGLQNLKKAAEKGHPEASYLYNIILLCTVGEDDQSQQEKGLELISTQKESKKCRKKIKSIIGRMWPIKHIGLQKKIICPSQACVRRNNETRKRKRGWPDLDDDSDEEYEYDVAGCELCKWDREVNLFCSMLRPYCRRDLVN